MAALASTPARAYVDQRVRGRTSHLISAGATHAFVIEHGGVFQGPNTYAWGTNGSGELGTGATSGNQTTPVTTKRFTQIAAGQSFTVAIDGVGALWGWGVTSAGQTAIRLNGTAVTAPTKVSGSRIWKNISAGSTHACGITGGGQLYCWGDNTMGELGQGTSGSSKSTFTPALVGASTDRWISVACGPQFTLALKANGTAWAWGSNSTGTTESGQLGINDTADLLKTSPTQIGTKNWVALAAGGAHGLGIQEDGSLWSWGYNTGGELGDGSTTRHSGPVAIEVGSTFIGVAAGALDSFALRADGSLRAFGTNAVGQLGCPSCSTTTPTKSPVTIGANYQFVAAGADFTLAVTADGNLQTWGNNGSGQLGRAGATNTPTIIPDSSIGTFANIKPGAVTGGAATSESPTSAFNGARIKSSGVLEMWGDYGDSAFATKALGLATGQTGTVNEYASCDTTNKICWSPLPVAYQHKSSGNVLAAPWREVATGANTTLAISADGTLWAWGLNASGEAGVGNTASVDLPTQVSGGTTIPWLRVFADPAGFGTVAIKADGSLWQWGAGATSTPAQKCTSGACSGKHFSVVTVDSNGTLAIATDGSLWGWTNNGAPLQVNGSNPSVGPTGTAWSALTWIDVQVHAQDSEALDSGGNVWSWGYNVYGQIGNGTVTADGLYPLPVIEQASVMTNAVNVASCPTSELALDAQNQLWGWGENGNGETGLQTSAIEWATNAYTGHQPGSGQTIGTNWFAAPILSAIACGGADSLLLDDDGWVWGLGANNNGQLGLGSGTGSGNALTTQETPIYPEPYEPNYAYASVNNANAPCPNTGCTWTTTSNQASGQWYTMDLGSFQSPQFYTSLRLVSGNANNYPRSFKVLVSNDNSTFTQVATGTGASQYVTASFPLQSARYVRVQLTAGASAPWDLVATSINY